MDKSILHTPCIGLTLKWFTRNNCVWQAPLKFKVNQAVAVVQKHWKTLLTGQKTQITIFCGLPCIHYTYYISSIFSSTNPFYRHLKFTVHPFKAGLGSRQIFFRLRLRLLIFFLTGSGSGSGSWFFFQAAPAPAPRSQKHPAPAPDYWLSLPKYSFPHKLVR